MGHDCWRFEGSAVDEEILIDGYMERQTTDKEVLPVGLAEGCWAYLMSRLEIIWMGEASLWVLSFW